MGSDMKRKIVHEMQGFMMELGKDCYKCYMTMSISLE